MEKLPTEPDPRLVNYMDDGGPVEWWMYLLWAILLGTAFGCVIWSVAT